VRDAKTVGDLRPGAVSVRRHAGLAESEHVMLGSDEMQWADAPPSLPRGAIVVVIEGKPSEPGPFTMRLKFPAG